MQNIGNFLERFKNLTIPDGEARKELAGVIKNETGVDLETKNISIKEPVAYIKCGSAEKSEIFLNKKKILNKLSTDKKITDIK